MDNEQKMSAEISYPPEGKRKQQQTEDSTIENGKTLIGKI